MASPAAGTSGRTLGSRGPLGVLGSLAALGSVRASWCYVAPRAIRTVVAVVALVVAVGALATQVDGYTEPGVVGENVGGVVLSVAPTGWAWSVGIRPGQLIVGVRDSSEAGGWSLETRDASGVVYEATAAPYDQALRNTLPLGVGAVLFAMLAVVLLGTRRQWVVPAAAVALLLAAEPLKLAGNPFDSTVALAAAAIVPTGAATLRLPGRWPKTLLLGAVIAGFVALWAVARLNGWSSVAGLEEDRAALAFWATLLVVGDRVLASRRAHEPIRLSRPSVLELGVMGLLVAVGVALLDVPIVPSAIVLPAMAVAIVALPALRRRLRPIERAVLGDVREQASLEAAESERTRLAGELHDVPLQELVGIMRRVERIPGAEREAADLRALAGHLRGVAMDLHPSVLDDLGLRVALEDLADQAGTPELPVTTELESTTGFGRDERPPERVEIAVYRMAAEAVGNAVRHSRATHIGIRGRIEPRSIELEIRDDGSGFDAEREAQARREGHLGLASMRRRADAIDADLEVLPLHPGTSVRVTWRA